MRRRAEPVGRVVARLAGGALVAASLVGCIAPTEPLPHDVGRGAPSDGEMSVYDVTTRDGTLFGRTSNRWRRGENGFDLARGPADVLVGEGDPESVVTVDPTTGLVLAAWRGQGEARTEATWDAARSVVVVRRGQVETPIPVPAGVRENDELLEALRWAGLQPGTSVRTAIFNVGMQAWIPAQVDALGATDVTTPAGTFRALDVRIGFGTQYHHAFIEEAPPHRVVRYDNAGGTRLVLRSHRASAGDGAPIETTPVVVPRAQPKLALILTTLLAQWPLMILLPIVAAFRLRKAYALPWSTWGLGAAGFVLSQLVHLPLNWALGLMGAPRALGLASPPVVAAALGLSAGLCEELTRWAILHRLVRRGGDGTRSGLVAGAGHGGVESLIFGGLAAATAISMWAIPLLPPSWVGIPPEAREAFAKQLIVYWSTGWEAPVWGGVERVSAMLFHVAMSVLIARGVERGRALPYVAIAVLAHAAVDGVVVYAMPRSSLVAVELGMLASSLALGALVVRAVRVARAGEVTPREQDPAS